MRAQLAEEARRVWRADVFAASVRSVFRVMGRFNGVFPAAHYLAEIDDGSGSWDDAAWEAGIEWDYAARRPGEEYPLDYQVALYWPEAGPDRLGCGDPLGGRGGEHDG